MQIFLGILIVIMLWVAMIAALNEAMSVAVIALFIAICLVPFFVAAHKASKNSKEINEEESIQPVVQEKKVEKRHSIVCPFCYEEFYPQDVRFRFDIDGAVRYFKLPPAAETESFCRGRGYICNVIYKDGIPVEMQFLKNDKIDLRSPVRVCANAMCNQILSNNAGTYPSDNGLFIVGLKSSGKTVFITSAIYRLMNVIPRYFKCLFNEYNSDVSKEYQERYYTPMIINKELPAATINKAQLTYEVTNPRRNQTVGITFSDIKGELSGDAASINLGDTKNAVVHSNYYLLTIDIKEIAEDPIKAMETKNIINNVLKLAVIDPTKNSNKYLAVVITKSDELVGFEGEDIFVRDQENSSPIYKTINYEDGSFESEREIINKRLREYLYDKYPAIVLSAESAFDPKNVNYFAVSALGRPPEQGKIVTDEIMPIRVEEPVIWLLNKSGVI